MAYLDNRTLKEPLRRTSCKSSLLPVQFFSYVNMRFASTSKYSTDASKPVQLCPSTQAASRERLVRVLQLGTLIQPSTFSSNEVRPPYLHLYPLATLYSTLPYPAFNTLYSTAHAYPRAEYTVLRSDYYPYPLCFSISQASN